MRKKKSFCTKKATALALAFALSLTGVTGNAPTLTQAASNSFTLTNKVTIGDGETYQLDTKGNTKGISFQSSNKKNCNRKQVRKNQRAKKWKSNYYCQSEEKEQKMYRHSKEGSKGCKN